MAYRRYRKRRYNPIKKRARIYGRAGYQLYKDVRYLQTLVNSEMNYHITTANGTVDDNGSITSLADIPVGDAEFNRSGTSVLPRFLTLRLTFEKSQDASSKQYSRLRVMIFQYWGESTSAAPSVAVSEILSDATNPCSFLNDDNTGARGDRERRIRVARNQILTLDKVGYTSRTLNFNMQVNGPKKKVKEHIKFRSTTTEQPISNGFYVLLLSSDPNALGAATKVAYTLDAKLNFYDN